MTNKTIAGLLWAFAVGCLVTNALWVTKPADRLGIFVVTGVITVLGLVVKIVIEEG